MSVERCWFSLPEEGWRLLTPDEWGEMEAIRALVEVERGGRLFSFDEVFAGRSVLEEESAMPESDDERMKAVIDLKNEPLILTPEEADAFDRLCKERAPRLAKPLPVEEADTK